jgi:hypothetical protein
LTPDGRAADWQAIRRFHTSYRVEGSIIDSSSVADLIRDGVPVEKPWLDIGYHFGIEQIAGHYEILAGRMPNMIGAHCEFQNSDSLGVCFVGNFDNAPPPEEQWRRGLALVRALMFVFNIPADKVFGHRQFNPAKSCPGRQFDLEKFRREVSR